MVEVKATATARTVTMATANTVRRWPVESGFFYRNAA